MSDKKLPEDTIAEDTIEMIDSPKQTHPRRKRKWGNLGIMIAMVCAASILAGAAGYLIAIGRAAPAAEAASEEVAKTMWTCSMHPQVKLPEFGLCPICGMDLIPLEDNPSGPRELKMSKEAVALAGIEVEPVERKFIPKIIRMVGKVAYDETKTIDITAWIPGRLDRLYVDYTGMTVHKGDHLVYMYSPDLIVAQRELLQAWEAYNGPDELGREVAAMTLKSTEEKLRLFGVLKKQVEEIKRSGEPSDHLTIYSPVGGIVVGRHSNEGAYVQTGTKIYSIVDLSEVWIYLDAYESDIPWLQIGQEVQFNTESYPGEIFRGQIAFIDPVLSETTRTARVRVNVPNPNMKLKPGMFVRAMARSEVAIGGRVFDKSLAGKWTCPMHHEIIEDGPGKCPICEMPLEPIEQLGYVDMGVGAEPPLVIPVTAPLVTGKRAVVYLRVPTSENLFRTITAARRKAEKLSEAEQPSFEDLMAIVDVAWRDAGRFKKWQDAVEMPPGEEESNFDKMFGVIKDMRKGAVSLSPESKAAFDDLVAVIETAWQKAVKLTDWEGPSFDGREIVLGERVGDYYIVKKGLEEGELVVTAGNFKIDADLQINAKPSMMSMVGGAPAELSAEELRTLTPVYTAYLKIQEALTDDRLDDARSAWKQMREAVKGGPSESMSEQVTQEWKKTQNELAKNLAIDLQETNIKELRTQFKGLAAAMLRMADTFGQATDKPLYEAFCPMAFDKNGASWLQAGKTVANPYFGREMLTCGSIRRTFNAAEPPPKDTPAGEPPGKEDPR